jgi:hypothetical protein
LRSAGESPSVRPTNAGQEASVAEQGEAELVLTYAELGARLGVSVDGARTRAKRAGWPVIIGNDGKARVRIRPSELPEQMTEQMASKAEQDPNVLGLVAEQRRIHAERVAELHAELDRARSEVERWRAAAEQARVEAERERALNGLLRDSLDHERVLNRELRDELKAMLAEAWRPFWRRWWR